MKIVEIRGSSEHNRKVIFDHHQMKIGWPRESMLLPKPILIQTGFKYEIQLHRLSLNEVSTEKIFVREPLYRVEHLKPNVPVQFHDDPIENDTARGLVLSIKFNKIMNVVKTIDSTLS